MITKTIDVRDAYTRFSELLSTIASGAEVLLTEGDTPVARVVPITAPTNVRVAGLHRGAFWTSDDFDEPLDELMGASGE